MDGIAQDDRDDVDRRVGDLAERFAAAGWAFFVVGGVVRDLFLGADTGDVDVTTDATPADTTTLLQGWADSTWEPGIRFGTVGARKGDVIVEITTHRSEQYHADSRKPEVEFSSEIHEDLARRDFTINAMAIELPDWRLVDPYDGESDLMNRVLRTPLAPEIAFSDDPLRMLRAARFLSNYQLTLSDGVENAMNVMAERLDIVSKERVNEEFSKLLAIEHPTSGIRLLQRTGLMGRLFPDMATREDLHSGALDLVRPDLELRWACLLWPVLQDGTEARRALARLRLSNATASAAAAVIDAARDLVEANNDEQSTARQLLHRNRHSLGLASELLNAYKQPPSVSLLSAIDQILEVEGDKEFQVPLDGHEVAELVGGEGPLVGEMLDRLMEHRVQYGPMSKEEALAMIQEWRNTS